MVRTVAGWVLAFVLAATIVTMIAVAAAGFIVLLPFAVLWFAKPLPTFDDEVEALLREAR